MYALYHFTIFSILAPFTISTMLNMLPYVTRLLYYYIATLLITLIHQLPVLYTQRGLRLLASLAISSLALVVAAGRVWRSGPAAL